MELKILIEGFNNRFDQASKHENQSFEMIESGKKREWKRTNKNKESLWDLWYTIGEPIYTLRESQKKKEKESERSFEKIIPSKLPKSEERDRHTELKKLKELQLE